MNPHLLSDNFDDFLLCALHEFGGPSSQAVWVYHIVLLSCFPLGPRFLHVHRYFGRGVVSTWWEGHLVGWASGRRSRGGCEGLRADLIHAKYRYSTQAPARMYCTRLKSVRAPRANQQGATSVRSGSTDLDLHHVDLPHFVPVRSPQFLFAQLSPASSRLRSGSHGFKRIFTGGHRSPVSCMTSPKVVVLVGMCCEVLLNSWGSDSRSAFGLKLIGMTCKG